MSVTINYNKKKKTQKKNISSEIVQHNNNKF